MNPVDRIRTHLEESARVTAGVAQRCAAVVRDGAELVAEAFRSGGQVLLCGNGGSAADCQHVAAEFVSRLSKAFERPALPAIALTTDTSFLTAFANDSGFDGIFARQIEALGRPGDVLIAISTSGGSTNVLRAVEAARQARMRIIALTGDGGPLAALADVAIVVPSRDTQHVQEAHLAIEHALCDVVEQRLFG